MSLLKGLNCLMPVLLYSALVALSASNSAASIVTYDVSMNTAFLTGITSGFTWPPYYLDFQFTAGDTSEPTPNIVTVTSTSAQFSAFNLTAGAVPGSGENLLPFTPASPTSFTLAFTENIEPESTPDLLSIYICDATYDCLATTDPSSNNTILDFTESLSPASPGISQVSIFDTPTNNLSTSAVLVTGSSPIPTTTPEPSTFVMGGFGLLLAVIWFRRRRSTAAVA